MQQQKSSFKNYLELFRFLDWKAVGLLISDIYYTFYKIFLVQITAGIIGSIENADPEQLRFLVKVFVALTILYYVATWSSVDSNLKPHK
jgi:hypothetical protein